MTNILLVGAAGRMGTVIAGLAKERDDLKILAGIDVTEPKEALGFPVYTDYAHDELNDVNVIVDFSNPKALDGVLTFAMDKKIPVILCSTGYSEAEQAKIHEAAKEIPVFFSANMSIGVNLIAALAKKAAEVLYPGFNIEIVEAHHNQKLDAPSGTAVMLADRIKEALPDDVETVTDRSAIRAARPENQIGIASVRGGSIVGEHEILFAGPDEVVKISHSAYSRKIFGNGALNAAVWLTKKPHAPGMYSMDDLL